MYIKLAIQNMKKSIRNYVIYFVTITLTAAMMYSFLALGFSKEVLTMSENISMLTSGKNIQNLIKKYLPGVLSF